MRTALSMLVFVVLLLAGFLVTPGIFRTINAEYQLALRDASPDLKRLETKLVDAADRLSAVDKTIAAYDHEISFVEGRLFGLQTERVDEKEKNSYLDRLTELKQAINGLQDGKKRIVDEIQNSQNLHADLMKKIEGTASESYNFYLVTRALALGAVGTLMSFFAKFGSASGGLFEDRHAMARLWTSMAIGAVVGVVALGLMHTRQISVFSHSGDVAGNPDFWRVTILCLLAGAFSDRLFQAAAGRVEQYLGAEQKPKQELPKSEVSAPPKAAPKKAAKRTRKRRASPRQAPRVAPALVEVRPQGADSA
jgi:hypothetical protein